MSLSHLRIASYAYKYTTSQSISLSSYSIFSSFPHGTCALSVNHGYLGLVGDSTAFTRNYTSYHLTHYTVTQTNDYLARANLTQGYNLLWLRDSLSLLLCYAHAFIAPLQPFRRFRSPLLTASSLFLLSELVRCFNSLELYNIHILHIKLYIVILQSAH